MINHITDPDVGCLNPHDCLTKHRRVFTGSHCLSFSGCNPDITLAELLSHRVGLQEGCHGPRPVDLVGPKLVGVLEHEFYDFPYIGKNHPNLMNSYFSQGLKPPTSKFQTHSSGGFLMAGGTPKFGWLISWNIHL